MKKIIVILCSMICIFGCIKDKPAGADLKVGDSLPDFEIMMSDGTVVSDDDLRKSSSVVVFFHTACPDCQQVLPHIQRIYDEYIGNGVLFILVSREESNTSVASFWEQNRLEMPYSAQNSRDIYEQFAKERIPRIYINEKGGTIRYIFTDDPRPVYDDIKVALESVIR